MIQPCISKFVIANTRLVESPNMVNYGIFKNIIPKENLDVIETFINILINKELRKINRVASTSDNYKQENNKYILIILQELNKFLPDEMKIYGYRNIFDQKEIALCEKSKLIVEDSIKISEFKKIKMLNSNKLVNEIEFPTIFKNYDCFITNANPVAYISFGELDKINKNTKITNYLQSNSIDINENRVRMIRSKQISISYTDFDNPSNIIDNTDNKAQEKYYEKKYKKYKAKYLALKIKSA
jgi:hypothetical protein